MDDSLEFHFTIIQPVLNWLFLSLRTIIKIRVPHLKYFFILKLMGFFLENSITRMSVCRCEMT